jgi:hypothetical protein
VLGLEDHPELAGVGGLDLIGHLRKLLVQVPVPAGGLVADGKRTRHRAGQPRPKFRPGTLEFQALEAFAVAVENLRRRAVLVNVQPDVVHGKPPFGW